MLNFQSHWRPAGRNFGPPPKYEGGGVFVFKFWGLTDFWGLRSLWGLRALCFQDISTALISL